MTTITIKNASVDGDVLNLAISPSKEQLNLHPRSYLTNSEIKKVLKKGQAYHLSDKLTINLKPGEKDSSAVLFLPEMISPVEWKASLIWKIQDSDPKSGFERDMFSPPIYISDFIQTSTNSNEASLDMRAATSYLYVVYPSFKDASLLLDKKRLEETIPREGLLFIQFKTGTKKDLKKTAKELENKLKKLQSQSADSKWIQREFDKFTKEVAFENVESHYHIIKVSIDPALSAVATPTPAPARGTGNNISVYQTPPTAVDSLFVPSLSAELVYNFLEQREFDYDVAFRKNYTQKKLTDIPRYVRLKWSRAPRPTKQIFTTSPGSSNVSSAQVSDFVGNGKYSPKNVVKMGNKIVSVPQNVDPQMFLQSAPKTNNSIFGGTDLSKLSNLGATTVGNSAVEQVLKDVALGKSSSGQSSAHPDEEDLIIANYTKRVSSPDGVALTNQTSEYCGYIIIKQRLRDSESDSWETVDYIPILDVNKTDFIDTRIAYGEVYRYRIRSVFKFVNSKNLTMFEDYKDTDTSLQNDSLYLFSGGQNFSKVYYFDSKLSNQEEISIFDGVRPDPPNSIKIFPNSRKKQILLTWAQKQQQRDVQGFNVYRRTEGTSFQKLNLSPLEQRNNFYLDDQVEYETEYIYAIESIDMHDNSSKLSFQYAAKLKEQDFIVGNTQYPLRVVVDQNLEIGEELVKPEKELISARSSLMIAVNPLFLTKDSVFSYLIKIKSLDTFMEKEVKLNFDTKLIIHKKSIPSIQEKAQRIAKFTLESLINYSSFGSKKGPEIINGRPVRKR